MFGWSTITHSLSLGGSSERDNSLTYQDQLCNESAVKKLGRLKVAFTPIMESMLFGFTGAQLRRIAFQFAILDGHKTHTNNLSFTEMARKNHVTVLCLPPDCSHRMQPRDVSFMEPLMTCYTQSVENSRRMVTTFQTAGLIRSAYGKTGIWPVDRHIFLHRDFAAASTNIDLMADVASHSAGDRKAPQTVQQTDRDTVPHAALAVGVAEAPRDTVFTGTGMDVAQVPGCGSLAPNAAHDILSPAVANTNVATNVDVGTEPQQHVNCGSRKTCNTRASSAQIEVVEDIATFS